MSEAEKKMQWPNLSSYGVTLGVVDTSGGAKSLVFSDETGKYAHIARGMGFSRTRWPGLWVRSDVRLVPGAFRSAFPKLEIGEKTASDIADEILTKISGHVNPTKQQDLFGFSSVEISEVQRVRPVKNSKKSAAANEADLPAVTQVAEAAAEAIDGAQEGMVVDISPLSVDNLPMGYNRLGEEVYQAPDGRRFSRIETEDGAKIRREINLSFPDPTEAGLFLRGDTPESLNVAAEGLVWAMAHGRTIRVDDFAQFFRATTGRELAKNVGTDPDFDNMVGAVDRARVRRLSEIALSPDADAFAAALRLHDAAQYYSLIKDSRMTPLPIGVALQHMAMSMPQGSSIRVTNADRGEFSILSGGYFKTAEPGEQQDILLGAYEGNLLEKTVEAFGTTANRNDHAETLKMLEQMSANGLGIFMVDGDAIAGRIGPSSRRFLDTLATNFNVEGMVDVDGMLMGVPGSAPKRILVIGAKHESPVSAVLPESLPFVTDYESLWRWGDSIAQSIRKPGTVSYAERGAIAPQDAVDQVNSFQSPYIPTSTLSDPTLMVPRNLASPLRRAMIEIQRTTPHTDQWLAEQLQMTMEELRDALSPEQADAAVMAIKRIESGMGFMVADQTGTGKGRILAATALYQRLRGEPVVFLTEKAELFTDFWRDIENIGATRHFQNIFILNDGVKVISPRTEELIAQSADRAELDQVLRSMELPKNVDLVMATYSQFNRDPVKATKARGEIDIDSFTKNTVGDAVSKMINRAKAWRMASGKKEIQSVSVDAIDIFSNPQLVSKLPLEAIKPIWIGRAMKGANLIMDESHNMSGESSQTALNLIHATMNAKSVLYSSATFARAEKNMRAYRRLFPASVDVEALHETLKKGGEPLQEALSSMLAEDGALVRREHDLSMLKFDPRIDKKNTVRNEGYADKLAEILAAMASLTREVREYSDSLSEQMKNSLIAANAAKGAQTLSNAVKDIGVVKRSSIGNGLYTTMRAFLTVIKNDLVVERAVANLKEGRKPGIIIEHTMEADLNRAVERARESGELKETEEGLIIPRPSFRTLLKTMLEDMSRVSLDGNELEIKKGAAFSSTIRLIEQKIAEFPDLPLCPLDYVRQGIEKAGYKCVELSGRKRDLVDMGDGNVLVRKIAKGARGQAKERFNNGDADSILLTRAGNSGISLHASPTFLNTQQRVVIEAEVPEDVVVRVQFFGRFNRKDQLSHPIVETMSSDLPAENRNLALQNNKLRKMSANVTANRDNAAITKDIADIINVVGNEVAFKFLELRPELAIKLDVSMPEMAERMSAEFELRGDKYVSQLFQKMVMLPVVQQREVIFEMTREFELTVEELESIGENPLRAKFYDVHAKKLESDNLEFSSTKVFAENNSQVKISTFDQPVLITKIEYSSSYKPMSRTDLMIRIIEGKDRLIESISENYGNEIAISSKSNPDVIYNFITDAILSSRDEKMESSKAARHATVADALADQENNMVKNIQWKTDKIMDLMSSLRIGSLVSFTNNDNLQIDQGIVVRSVIPELRDVCVPGRYAIEIVVPSKNFSEKISLSRLIEDTNFHVLEKKASEKSLSKFDGSKGDDYTTQRNILDGNLFRAAEVSIQAGVGVQAHFSDEHGMANRAVMLPWGTKKDLFATLPIRITDVDLSIKFFNEVKSGKLVSTASKKSETNSSNFNGILISKVDGELIISLPGNIGRQSWLKNNHELMAITGPFAGSRNILFAAVPGDQAEPLLNALYKSGVTFYAHPTLIAHQRDLPAHGSRYISQKERDKLSGAISARDWFVKEINEMDASASQRKELEIHDPLAELENPSFKKFGRR